MALLPVSVNSQLLEDLSLVKQSLELIGLLMSHGKLSEHLTMSLTKPPYIVVALSGYCNCYAFNSADTSCSISKSMVILATTPPPPPKKTTKLRSALASFPGSPRQKLCGGLGMRLGQHNHSSRKVGSQLNH